jgi:alkylated DNA repair dioxygenase AlkB
MCDSVSTRIDWIDTDEVPGFSYYDAVLSPADEADIVLRVENEGRWEQDYQRRAQRYGFGYEYDTKTLTKITPVPSWLLEWAVLFCDRGWMRAPADQVTVQEYRPGAGIGDHCDDRLCFGPDIATISLLAPCTYRLTQRKERQMHVRVLQPRSVVVLQGDARRIWKHGILTTKTDAIRERRLSLTFRTINPQRVRT